MIIKFSFNFHISYNLNKNKDNNLKSQIQMLAQIERDF